MTSHLTVSTPSPKAGSSTSGLANATGDAGKPLGAFGAMLSALETAGTDAANGIAQTMAGLVKGTASKAPPHTGFVHIGPSTTPAAGAAGATDGTDGDTAGTPPQLLRDAVDSLAALDKAEQSGKPVDADLLKRAKDAVDALASYLAGLQGVQLPVAGAAATPPADATAPPGSAVAAAGTTANPGLAAAMATLTALDGKLTAMASTLAQSAPDLSAKLQQLAKILDPTTLGSDELSQLGLTSDGETPDPQLTAAINSLVNGKAAASSALQPTIGAPALKLPDGTALGGDSKPASTPTANSFGHHAASAAAATAPSNPAPSGDGSGSAGSQSKGGSAANPAAGAASPTTADEAKAIADATTPAPGSSATVTAPPAPVAAGAPLQGAAQAAYAPPGLAAAVNLPQMAVEIARYMQQGTNHFQIRLDPADMGRVDVKLAIDATGAVNAHISVEHPETLALLQRDAGALGQALVQAGLDGSKTNLQFSLSQNPFAGQNSGSGGNNPPPRQPLVEDDAAIAAVGPASAAILYRGTVSPSGLNIVV